MSEKGLIHAYLLDQKGGGRKLAWEEVLQWQPEQGLLWMHLDYSQPEIQKLIREDSDLSEITADILLADETRPRCLINDDGVIVILRGINRNPGADPEDMVAVRILATQGRIITCRKRRLTSAAMMADAIEAGHGPDSAGSFLAQIAELMVSNMAHVIDDMDERTDDLENPVNSSSSRELRNELSSIRRTIIHLRRYLAPQRDALNRLIASKVNWISDDERDAMHEVSDQTMRYLEDLDSARERADVTHEELSQLLTEQSEKRIYILTIITAIFLPLAFLTGLLGINVAGIPGAQAPLAFLVVCAIMLGVVVLEMLVLRWLKWI